MWIMILGTIWLLAASIMDIRTRRVPIWLLAVGSTLAVTAAVYRYEGCMDLLKSLLPGVLLLLVGFITKKAGYGDGVVLLCLGLFLGDGKGLLLFGLGLFLAAFCSLILLALRKVGRSTAIPFIPFLAAAWLIIAGLEGVGAG